MRRDFFCVIALLFTPDKYFTTKLLYTFTKKIIEIGVGIIKIV